MIKNLRKNKKGFTLVEIIVVVVILAVLMAVAVPSVMKYVNEADEAKYMAQARGAMIVAQAESARSWINKDSKITDGSSDGVKTWTASTSDVQSVTGDPEVKGIVAELDANNGNINKITVTFDGSVVYEVTPNGKVAKKGS